MLHPSFSLTTTTGLRVMATPLPAPIPSTAEASKPKPSPPSAETLCLKTFQACWYLDKDWLVSFVASAQCAKPDAPITWVEFMPKGHTHLVWSALKLVPISKHLPLAKIKEVMFTFILEVLNAPGSSPSFNNALKAVKSCKRIHKCKLEGKQSVAMAIDAPPSNLNPPPLSTRNPLGSTPVSDTGARNGGDKGEIHPRPSSEAPGTRGDAEMPRTSTFPDQDMPPPMSLKKQHMEVRRITTVAYATHTAEQHHMVSQASLLATSRALSPSPLITSVLSKRASPPPPTSPLPPVGSPIPYAPQDWYAWME